MSNQPKLRTPSARAQIITRRTYNRPKPDGTFETWAETVDRVIGHQRWLWERAAKRELAPAELAELDELRALILDRKVFLSGRTLWLGGTEVAKRREASMFNCSFARTATVADVVDQFWLLLQGCGVGFEPITGTLSGFAKRIPKIEVIRSSGRHEKGHERNREDFYTVDGVRVWWLSVGDSAEAWAKALGKLLANKNPVDHLVLDFSEIRGAGVRLKGYGWISSGDETLSEAVRNIADLLNGRAGQLLTRIDILDIMNHLGTCLSSRRSAEIALMPITDPEAEEFIQAKKDFWLLDRNHRAQSNNSVVFHSKPSKLELRGIFSMMQEAGGSEPGFINAVEAKRRAPWFAGCNPCAEILLGDKSFCNLVEVSLPRFNGDFYGLLRAIHLAARANYRQTCVNLEDGILQRAWHEQNQQLRLCGVGLTGFVQWDGGEDLEWWCLNGALQRLQSSARLSAQGMADELGLPHPKAVTTIKPSGTLSKIGDVPEGAHAPLGRFIFNNVRFAHTDPMLPRLKAAGYHTFQDPLNPDATLVRLPVEWSDIPMFTEGLNLESAVDQLERYRLLMDNYVDHNCSVTISYSPEEVPAIVDWLHENWDAYVGVSFLYRTDPTQTAADLGYPYLPQEVVSEQVFREYADGLLPVDLDAPDTEYADAELVDADCATGACPVR